MGMATKRPNIARKREPEILEINRRDRKSRRDRSRGRRAEGRTTKYGHAKEKTAGGMATTMHEKPLRLWRRKIQPLVSQMGADAGELRGVPNSAQLRRCRLWDRR